MVLKHRLIRGFCAMLCAVALTVPIFAADPSTKAPTGTDASATEMILVNGKSTGVALTQYSLAAGTEYARSEAGLINVIELSPTNENVAIKVLNGGDYTWSRDTVGAAAMDYNKREQGTVIAAMNTDPWIVYHTDYDGDGIAATGPAVKHVSVSRGLIIIDGEIWASAQISDENNLARNDNAERGTPAANQPVFGIRADGSAVIGTPILQIQITNATSSQVLGADGINRLPAPNSTLLYNQRCGTESFAFSDAYEIYLECDSSAMGIGKVVTGRVTHIFESGNTSERPAIGENTLVISARGDAIGKNQGRFSIGDVISIECTVTGDARGLSLAEDWQDVLEATAGFYTLIENGVHMGQELSTSYPCTIAGVKRDGTIVLICTTSQKDGSRSACRMQDMQELAEALGCYTAIMFDGGGSTQMVSLEGDGYVRRCAVSDGKNSVRGVISALALVYTEEDAEPQNYETRGFKLLDGLGKQSTFDGPGARIEGAASYAYYYVGEVAMINGELYDGLRGMRDPAYNVSWSAEQKKASIKPAVLDGSNIRFENELVLRISGYAFANGAQTRLIYSVDGTNWYDVVDGSYANASDDLVQTVVNNGWIKTASAEHAVFEGVGAPLAKYEGQTLSLYFALTPGSDDKALHFLTIENLSVALSEAEPLPPSENDPEDKDPEPEAPEPIEPDDPEPIQPEDPNPNDPEPIQPDGNDPEPDPDTNEDTPVPSEDPPSDDRQSRNLIDKWILCAVIVILVCGVILLACVLLIKRRK